MTPAMMLPDRMLEQVESWTAWDRRTWEPSTVLRLRELSEACTWVAEGVLSESALAWLRASLRPLIGQDRGLGVGAVQQQLDALLKGKLTRGSQAQRQLDHLIEFASESYLEHWNSELSQASPISVERTSRFITSHVVDSGYHPEWLRVITKQALDNGAGPNDLVQILAELLNKPATMFTGVVPILSAPELSLLELDPAWMPPRELAQMLRRQDPDGEHPRHVGGIKFEVVARDPRAAAAVVQERLERLVSRTRLLRAPKSLAYYPTYFLHDGTTVRLTDRGPQVHVLSLVKTGTLYSASLNAATTNAIDDSMQLASQLTAGPATVAVAGAWAALESLLVTGADNSRDLGRALAADRAATLVAAGWPRAELTRLSHRVQRDAACPERLKRLLESAGDDNLERCAALLDWLPQSGQFALATGRDQAALERMTALVANPSAVLGRVRGYMTGSLRRLYRQRNLVLHGGSHAPVALGASIRTAGPLVGAALDRVSHAFELNGIDPLDAVARAECALKAVGGADGWPLHRLAVA